jgi:hypothetical protein
MKAGATSLLIAVLCLWALSLPACGGRRAAAKAVVDTPKPGPAKPPGGEDAADLPISVPQTQVTLPSPQPIHAEALPAAKPEAPANPEPAQAVKPPRTAVPRGEPRQTTTTQTVPAGPQPPPPAPPPASRRRIRPVESAAERRRLQADISTRQRQVQDILAKARNRQLSDAEKAAVDRVQAFLDQTEAALKDKDLQQAAALANRALLLCQELSLEK